MSLMDIVKRTDPSTVTQHGLYMRPLSDPSLHPLVAKPPPAAPTAPTADPTTPPADPNPAPADPPGTPQQTEQKVLSPYEGNTAHKPAEPAGIEATTEKSAGLRELAASQAAAGVSEKHHTPDSAPATARNALPVGAQSNSAAQIADQAELVGPSAVPNGPPATASADSTAAAAHAPTPMSPYSNIKGNGHSAKAPDSARQIKQSQQASDACAQPNKGAESRNLPGDSAESETWGRGRVSLLGDAAHATIPNGECWPCTTFSFPCNARTILKGAGTQALRRRVSR